MRNIFWTPAKIMVVIFILAAIVLGFIWYFLTHAPIL